MNVTCKICSVPLTKKQQYFKRKYCSRACYDVARSANIKVKCDTCGKLFTKNKYKLARRKNNYCSQECYWESIPKNHDYKYDVDFLDGDNELSAYFLGLFITDGHLSVQKSTSIKLSNKQLIYDLAGKFNYTNKITHYSFPEKNWEDQYIIQLTGRVSDKLLELGFNLGSKRCFIPECISDITFPHFLRGLIDGDGGINIVKRTGRLRSTITNANKEFLVDICNELKYRGVIWGKGTPLPNGNAYQLIFGHMDTVRMCNFMYKNANIKMDCKYKEFLQGLEQPVSIYQLGGI